MRAHDCCGNRVSYSHFSRRWANQEVCFRNKYHHSGPAHSSPAINRPLLTHIKFSLCSHEKRASPDRGDLTLQYKACTCRQISGGLVKALSQLTAWDGHFWPIFIYNIVLNSIDHSWKI